jgi:hypothetical protein
MSEIIKEYEEKVVRIDYLENVITNRLDKSVSKFNMQVDNEVQTDISGN